MLHRCYILCLESSMIFSAISISASSATYMWQIPSAWPITGILELAIMYCTNWLEGPLGMTRSMESWHF